jgi:Flp pilus assembly protein protease CpaA
MWNFLTFILTAILATVIAAGILTLVIELLQRGDLNAKLKSNARQDNHREAAANVGVSAGQHPS